MCLFQAGQIEKDISLMEHGPLQKLLICQKVIWFEVLSSSQSELNKLKDNLATYCKLQDALNNQLEFMLLGLQLFSEV